MCTKYTTAKELYERCKYFISKEYEEKILIENAINELEEEIKKTKNLNASIIIHSYGAQESEKELDKYRYAKYTKKMRSKLENLGYHLEEEKEYFSDIDNDFNYHLCMSIKNCEK